MIYLLCVVSLVRRMIAFGTAFGLERETRGDVELTLPPEYHLLSAAEKWSHFRCVFG